MRKSAFIALVAALMFGAATARAQTSKVNSLFDLLCSYYGICSNGSFTDTDVTVGTTAKNLTINSPATVEAVFTNNSANQCAISLSNQVTSTTGTQLPANSSISLIWNQDFDSVGAPWWAACSAAGSSIHVHQVTLH